VPVRSLVDLLIEVSGRRARLVETGPSGPAEHLCVDPRPAVCELGWASCLSLRSAAQELWAEQRARAAFHPASTEDDQHRNRTEPLEVAP
jgi:hypothetical protein